jgi:hypothetical protein
MQSIHKSKKALDKLAHQTALHLLTAFPSSFLTTFIFPLFFPFSAFQLGLGGDTPPRGNSGLNFNIFDFRAPFSL